MKKANLLLSMILIFTISFTGCKKTTEEAIFPGTDIGDGTGSYSLTIDGTTYTTLESEITMVYDVIVLAGKDNNNLGFSFTVTNIPAVGSSIPICFEDCGENDASILMMSDGTLNYVAQSGTISRTADKKVEISGTLISITDYVTVVNFSMTININSIIVI